jgi:hypothetical protein
MSGWLIPVGCLLLLAVADVAARLQAWQDKQVNR